MPAVTVSGYECARDLLPPVCANCGRPATDRVSLRFSWSPTWTHGSILFEFLRTQRMRIRLPVCSRHARWWRWKTVLILLSFLPVFGLVMAAYLYELAQPPGFAEDWLTLRLLCSGGAFLLVSGVVATILTGRIGPKELTDRHMTLDGVHESFAAALEEHRRENPDPLRADGYGDDRDDYGENSDSGD
jgi:hypothetical protein